MQRTIIYYVFIYIPLHSCRGIVKFGGRERLDLFQSLLPEVSPLPAPRTTLRLHWTPWYDTEVVITRKGLEKNKNIYNYHAVEHPWKYIY
jgi:hypothetical protein